MAENVREWWKMAICLNCAEIVRKQKTTKQG